MNLVDPDDAEGMAAAQPEMKRVSPVKTAPGDPAASAASSVT